MRAGPIAAVNSLTQPGSPFMRWTLRKFDALLGTVLAALAGIAFAQLPAFIQQYLQRVGGHIDEAHFHLLQVTGGESLRTLDAPAREVLTVSLEQRVTELQSGEQAISGASGTLQPLVFLRELDVDIAMATLHSFEPAVPLSLSGVIYGFAGMVAGWLLYEVLKAPAGFVLRRRRRLRTRSIEPS